MDTVPKAGESINRETEITLTVSGGQTTVPDFSLTTLADAENMATDSQLILNPRLDRVDTENPAAHGLVASQDPAAESRVTLQTPVTISVYRCPAQQRSRVIEVTLPESESDINVRVTLQAIGSTMEWTFVTYTCTVENGRTQKVTIEFPDERDYLCMTYADGSLIQRLDLSEE